MELSPRDGRYHAAEEVICQVFDTLWSVFLRIVKAHRGDQIYLVLDALDEYRRAEREELLDRLHLLASGEICQS
jgi:hypothetical protein